MNIAKRATSSLLNTILRAIINFATALLLANLLGPDNFGRYSFLLATFLALKQFLDMSSSEAFFKFISAQRRSKKFLQIYSFWIVIQLIIGITFIGVLLPETLLDKIWVGEQKLIILLAFMAMFFRETVWVNVVNLSESFRLTIYNQGFQTIVVLCHLIILAALWRFGSLVIELVFVASVLEWTVASIWLYRTINKLEFSGQQKSTLEPNADYHKDTVKSVINEFWEYCKFLIPYAWVGFFVDFSSRWMLQTWGSAEEQAYFAVGQQFAAISILAMSSVVKVFWKEVAEARHKNNFQRIEMLYTKSSHFLYFVASIVACMVLPWAELLISILLGNAYADALTTIQIMLIYPVHQTIGIITGTLLYATGHVKLQFILGLFFSAAVLVCGFYLMAPDTVWEPGLDLGSEGLAIRFVSMNIIFANVWAFAISYLFGWKFKLLYQLIILFLTFACGYIAKAIITLFFPVHTIMAMSISIILYLSMIAVLVYRYPIITGFTRDEILEFFDTMRLKRSEPSSTPDHNDRSV
ncbi:lipopolysaccharide biosynthesis protein [Pseudomonadales bacterium]|nr:lipopolysaccharide biosynthesis protein [Pseudomonadales bacterium]